MPDSLSPFILELEACEKIGELAGIIGRIRREATELEKQVRELRDNLDLVYEERARLVAFLAAVYPSWWSDDANMPGFRVIVVDTVEGQLSWHIASRDLYLFRNCRTREEGSSLYDGHSTKEKYRRLDQLTKRVEPWDFRIAGEPGFFGGVGRDVDEDATATLPAVRD